MERAPIQNVTPQELRNSYREAFETLGYEQRQFLESIGGRKWVKEGLLNPLIDDVGNAGKAARHKFKRFLEKLQREIVNEISASRTDGERNNAKAKMEVAQKMFGLIFPENTSILAQRDRAKEKTLFPLSPGERMFMNVFTNIARKIRDGVYKVMEWLGIREKEDAVLERQTNVSLHQTACFAPKKMTPQPA